MCHRKLIPMSPNAKLRKRIDLHITYVYLALIIIDKINLRLVIDCLTLVYLYYLLLLQQTP